MARMGGRLPPLHGSNPNMLPNEAKVMMLMMITTTACPG